VSEPPGGRLRIVEIVVGDDPDAWRAAGFRVDPDGCVRVSTVRFRLVGADGARGLIEWAVAGVDEATIDGIPGRVVEPEPEAVEGAAHPSTVTVLDHVVLATPDIDRTVAAFVALGCAPRRERRGGTEAMPLRQVFLRAGEVIVEIVGPPEPPDDAAPRARSAALWGLAFTVADLDACVALLGDVCGRARDAVQPGRRIASLRHDVVGVSVPTAFMSAPPAST
jgi:hypothetical protein